MNYEKVYNAIIENAKSQNRIKNNGIYYENHHIKPKSLFKDLEKDPNNLVLLTAKEHFICHMLLEKIYNCPQMKYAIWRMCNDNTYKVTARYYEYIKCKIQKESSILNKGKKHSKESIEKLRQCRLGHKHKPETIEKMKKSYDITKHKLTDETKQKLSKLATQRFKGSKKDESFKRHLSEIRIGENNPMYGKCNKDYMTDEAYTQYKKHLSESLKGHIISDETKRKIGEKTKMRTQGAMNPRARKVKIIDLNIEFGTIIECANYLNISRHLIYKNKNGNISIVNGHTISFL